MRTVTPCILVFAAALLAGCQNGQQIERATLDDQPLLDRRGRSQSLAFASPRLRAVTQDAIATSGLPWYAARSDARLAVQTGVRPVVTSVTRTYTVDRLSFHNNRPHNHYDRRRVRYEVTTGVR